MAVITLNPASAAAGKPTVVTGEGFGWKWWNDITFDGVRVARVQCSTSGKFTTTFVVPAGTLAGPHTVKARTYYRSAQATLTVTGVPVPVPPPPPPPPPPTTGKMLLDTARDGWGKFVPIYHQRVGTVAWDGGDKQDVDYGRSMAQTTVDAAGMTIRAERLPGQIVDSNTNRARPFASGCVGTKGTFAFAPTAKGTRVTFHGAKWPTVQGGFFALWFLADGLNQTPPEFDLVEAVTGAAGGNGPALVTTTNHTGNPGQPHVNEVVAGLPYIPAPASLVGLSTWADTPHDWSATFFPDRIESRVDGKLYGTFRKVPGQKLYPIIENGMGGPAYQTPPTGYRVTDATPNTKLTVARVTVEELG